MVFATLVISPAKSTVLVPIGPQFPLSVVVGQTFPAGLSLGPNISTPPESDNYPVITLSNITLVPACDNFNVACASGIEAGVFGLSTTGVGSGTGTNCAGTWTITETSPGVFSFVPPGGPTVQLATGQGCNVTYTVTALRVPTLDTGASPNVQTNQIATANLFAPGDPANNIDPINFPINGADTTTVLPATPSLSTLAVVGPPSGPGSLGTLGDRAFLQSPPPPSSTNGAPPQGSITFTLYGPFATAPGAGSCTVPFAVRGPVPVNGFRIPPASYDTPTPVNITTPGFYTYVAFYSGDPGLNPSYLPTSTICGDPDETREFLPAPTITVDKTATPLTMPEPGGTFTFNIVVTNTSPETVTLTSLTDDVYGNLNGQGTCATGAVLAANGGTYSCSFPGVFNGVAPQAQTDTVTAIATDTRGLTATDADDAVVSLTDVLPTITVDKTATPLSLPEPGGTFTFNVVVTNTSVEPVTLTVLTDDVYGNLNGQGTCATGAVLAANGGTYSCSFPGTFTGFAPAAQTDTVTANAVDTQGNVAADTDDAVVTLTDALPTIVVDKTANPLTLPEPGGNFTFTVVVTNTSLETVTITSLTDDVYGNLDDPANPNVTANGCLSVVGTVLAAANPGNTDTVTCTFTGAFNGAAPAAQTDVVTSTATDVQGNTATDSDDATVTLTDVLPTIVVDKTANPLTLPEPGGNFVFTVVVTNTSVEPVTIQSLTDNIYGDLDDPANPNVTGNGCLNVVGTVLAAANPGNTDTVSCTFTGAFTGDAFDAQTDIVTSTATDVQGNTATDSDDATVTLTDILPTIVVDKTAAPLILPEPGGAFTFTVVVTNTSSEPVTIQTLTDNIYGNLNDAANPLVTANSCVGAVGTVLAAANAGTTDTFTCSFTGQFTGAAPAAQTDIVTSTATDNDGNTATDNDDAVVSIGDVLPSITVDKTADPLTRPEPGGNFNFTVVVTNTSAEAVTIRALTDNIYGNLNDPANPNVTANGCVGAVGTVLAASNAGTTDTLTCTFTGAFAGVGGAAQTDIVSSTVDDTQGNTATDTDDATVTLTPLPTIVVDKTASPLTLPEPGGNFTFTVVITNTGTVPVTIQTLTDNIYGDLDDPANPLVTANGCLAAVGTPLAAANAGTTDTFTCSFTGAFAGGAGAAQTDIVTSTAVDADGNTATDTDDAVVTITGTAPVITVDKTANPLTLPEPGGAFTFTVVVTNTSTVEAVTITSLVDNIYGNLDDPANPLVTNNTCLDAVGTGLLTANPGTGDTFTCSFTGQFAGAAGAAQTDVVTAVATDNDGQTATDSDDAVVTITDVLPVITVNKTANPVTLPEPGGTFTFSVNVTNNSNEPVTITDLDDDVYGDIVTRPGSTCGTLIGDVIAPGATSDTCTFTGVFMGLPGDAQVDVVTATADDDDGNTSTDTDDATVTITNVVPTILVDKTATPPSRPEPGGVFTFNVVVTNVSNEQVTITTLTDDVYGNLATQGTCTNAIGAVLPAGGGTYSCSFTGAFNGSAGAAQTDVVTATAVDDQNTSATDTDDATVTITGVPPTVTIVKTASPTTLPEPGGNFTFTFVVTNTSPSETVTITSLTDDVYGNLVGRGNCAIGAVLAPSATYTCSFTVPFTGVPGATQTDVATVTVVDDDGEQATDNDDAVITITDIAPLITVQKTATPLTRNEPGGTFTFDVVITNTGTEVVTITDLTDNIYGNLNGRGTCAVGAVLPANGGTYRCSFTGDFFGNGGATQTDIVTASAVDDDGSRVTARDDATVRIVDVPPTVTVTKDADPVSRPEPGGSFTFVVTIVNTSVEPVTVVSITDDVYGNLVGRGTCVAGAVIQPGGSYRCQFTVDFRGTAGAFQVDRVFVTVVDNEGSRASANDDARISITPPTTPPVTQPLPAAPTPPAVTPQQLGRTGSDVSGPARLALALLVAGLLMLAATWRSKRGFGFALAPGGGPGPNTAWFTRSPSEGGIRRFLGGAGRVGTSDGPSPATVVVDPVTDLPGDSPVEGPDPTIEGGIDPDDDVDPDDTDPGGPGGGGAPPSGRGPSSGGGSDAASFPFDIDGGSDTDTGGRAAPPASGPDDPPSIANRADAIAPAPPRVVGAAPPSAYAAEIVVGPGPSPWAAAELSPGEVRSRTANARRIAGITRLVTMVALVAGVTHATGGRRARKRSAGRPSM